MISRYTFSDQAPNNNVYGSKKRFGVKDTKANPDENGDRWATLPGVVTLCYGMEMDTALDAYNTMRSTETTT